MNKHYFGTLNNLDLGRNPPILQIVCVALIVGDCDWIWLKLMIGIVNYFGFKW